MRNGGRTQKAGGGRRGVRMPHGIGSVYYTLVLACGTSRLYSDVVVRVLDFRLKGPGLDPWPGHGDFSRVRDK